MVKRNPRHDGHARLRAFGVELREFLTRRQLTLDVAFDGLTVAVPGAGGGAVWTLDGVVRGAYRVAEIGGPDPTRRLALAAAVVVSVDAGGAHARARLNSVAGGLRVDVDHPEILLGALPPEPDPAGVLPALADAGLRVEVHRPHGPPAVLDPRRPGRVADLLSPR